MLTMDCCRDSSTNSYFAFHGMKTRRTSCKRCFAPRKALCSNTLNARHYWVGVARDTDCGPVLISVPEDELRKSKLQLPVREWGLRKARMVKERFDVAVIGGGIAGASVAAELSKDRRVLLLEMENQPGYHTTGRSAAVFAAVYGPSPIRALTRASRSFFSSPPATHFDTALFRSRPIMMIARQEQEPVLDQTIAEVMAAYWWVL